MASPIRLFYWATPNGKKISIALEELALPYEVAFVNIGAGEQFAPEFLKISPNNRIPAIIDPDGPDGAPISVFESGAILLYLGRKSGRLLGETERQRVAVEEWIMWQMGGLGPMCGQAHHFIQYAPRLDPPQDIPYAKERYRNEVARLYRVLNERLADNQYVAGEAFSMADIAIWPWAAVWQRQGQSLDDKPHMQRWLEQVGARPAVQKGAALAPPESVDLGADRKAQDILFGKPRR